jgi:hypothetical protein
MFDPKKKKKFQKQQYNLVHNIYLIIFKKITSITISWECVRDFGDRADKP